MPIQRESAFKISHKKTPRYKCCSYEKHCYNRNNISNQLTFETNIVKNANMASYREVKTCYIAFAFSK